jgi:iron complex outermembrane receptor protein
MKLKAIGTTTSVLAVAGAIAFMPAAAFADSSTAAQVQADNGAQGGEIVVTAQRREEKARDVPITITSISQDQLATANVNSLSDTSKVTPGLRFDYAGAAMQPTIRGVGTAIATSGGGPNVGIYVDGFFQSNTYTADFDLMRVKDIQVLKGPQGTLFGRNTTGGAIVVTTADPSTTTSMEGKVSYGRFNELNLQGYATTGLTKDIAWDIEGNYRRGDGFDTNVLNGDSTVGEYENWSVRTGLKFQMSDSVSLLLRYFHSQTNDPAAQDTNAYVDPGSAGFFTQVSAAGKAIYGRQSSAGLPLIQLAQSGTNPYAPTPGTFATAPGQLALDGAVSFHTRSDAVQGTLKADLGFGDLTSYTQYRFDRTPYYGNLDATALNIFHILVDVYDRTFSQEFLLNSKAGSRLQWTVGLNYFENVDNWSDIQAEGYTVSPAFTPLGTYTPFGGSSTNTKSLAAFANATYEIAPDKLFLTLGGRFSHDTVTDAYFITNYFSQYTGYTDVNGNPKDVGIASGVTVPVPNLSANSFTPRVVLRYKPDNLSSVYASYTRGYKAGILNVGGDSQKPVAAETNDAFEVGYKYEAHRFGFDLSGFLYNYKNLQVSSYQSGAAEIRNAASARIYGIDAQGRFAVDQHLTLNAGATWLHAHYTSFANAPYYTYCDPNPAVSTTSVISCHLNQVPAGSIVETTTDASGYQMQRSPEFSGNVGAAYKFDLGGGTTTLSGNLYYTSSFYFDPEQQFKQGAYTTLSLRAQWVDPSKRFTVAVYGDNVTNKRYLTQVLYTTLGTGAAWNSPTTYGVSVGFKY